ncbi:UNVERIFIED_CONTAM: hypothetical protein NCL1_17027 [Trichonephila clavipes]
MIFYDFKAGSNQDECVQWMQLAFGDESSCYATDEEHIGRPRSAVIPDNVSALRKILMDDNRCTPTK